MNGIVSCLGVEDFNKQEEIYLKLIAGLNKFAYRREDGVYVVPISCLKD